nr:reverse transcriptase domain-containing protein [Tanacetum cinerariifolium]
EMATKFLSKYFPPFMVTKLRNDISNFRRLLNESLFEVWESYKLSIDRYSNHNMLPETQIDMFYNGLTLRHRDTINAATGGTFMKRRPKECYDLIENMTAHHNDWDTSAHKAVRLVVVYILIMSVEPSVATLKTLMLLRETIIQVVMLNLKEAVICLAIVLIVFLDHPVLIRQTVKIREVQRDPEAITDQVLTKSTTRVPPPVVQPSPSSRSFEIPLSPSYSPYELPKQNPHQTPIPYPSRLNKEKLQDKSDIQVHKFLQIFKKLHFNISLAEALALMLNGPPQKVTQKLRDPGKFLIPCDFPELEKCMALADLGSSINIMPLSVRKTLMLSELIPTRMTLELANRETLLRKASALVDVYGEELILRDDDEKLIFHADSTSKHPHNHDSSPTTDINITDPILERFTEERALVYSSPLGDDDDDDDDLFDSKFDNEEWKKLLCGDHFNDIHFGKDKIKDSKIKTLIDELEPPKSNVLLPQLLNFDSTLHEDLPEINTLPSSDEDFSILLFLPQGQRNSGRVKLETRTKISASWEATHSSPTTDINIIDPILERFTEERALIYSSSLGDDDDDDDLFDSKFDNEEWKKLLYGDHFNDIHFGKDKIKDSKIKTLIDELESPKSNVLLPQLLNFDSTLHEDLPEINTLPSFPFRNEDKVFNPGILVHGSTRFVTNKVTQDKNLKEKTSFEALVILEDRNFLSISSDQELLFHLELTSD